MTNQSRKKVILTLDAGGTNFVFSAFNGEKEVVSPIKNKAFPDDLDKCIDSMKNGFAKIRDQLDTDPAAISFAFPGPADYENGIIGKLVNLPAFTGDVPLGPILEDHFGLPVFINNDGNLFTLGEALSGFLPHINEQLEQAGNPKRYRNLLGITLGTGFGGGIVTDGHLLIGDNTSGGEIHNLLNKFNPDWSAEESVSTRAIRRVYAARAGIRFEEAPSPRGIDEIARGQKEGNREAARASYAEFGEALGNSIVNALALIDGLVVLGGGVTAGWDLFAPAMFTEIERKYKTFRGEETGRLDFRVFNLKDEGAFSEFVGNHDQEIDIPGTDRTVSHNAVPRTGIGVSSLGTDKAVAMGAWAFAMQKMED